MKQISLLVMPALLASLLTVTVPAPAPAAAGEQPPAAGAPVLRKKPAASQHAGPGCAWIGRRAVMSIVREDMVAANDLMTLYRGFSCEPDRPRRALDCVVKTPLADEAARVSARIDACWTDPETPTTGIDGAAR
ncbi:MAG: hypothetical protein ACFE0S_13195 [Rhodospirillales bacterium]